MAKKEEKALFVQRLIAYIIDMIIISCISSVLSYPFINFDSFEKLQKEENKVLEKYTNQKIDFMVYFNDSMDIEYQKSKITGFSNIITITILVLYFIVYQIYNSGQTIGKKIMKIRIVKNGKGILTMNNMIVRELFNNSIFVNIFIAIIALFGRNSYIYGSVVASIIQYAFIVITVFMIFMRKDGRGLSDFIGNTKVIMFSNNERKV